MSYSKQAFLTDFKVSVELRMGNESQAQKKAAQKVVDDSSERAWQLYEKTRVAPLGLQVFGRHKKNPSAFQGEPGIELYGEVFPRLKKKKFLGFIGSGIESEKKWKSRTSDFQEQLKHPTYPERQKAPIEFNFGIASQNSTGSILQMGAGMWHLNINDAWVLGGTHSHQPFYIAFKLSYDNVFSDNNKHNLTITGRELLGLLMSGYKLETGHASLGGVMVCDKPQQADKIDLIDYSIAAQIFEGPMRGMDSLAHLVPNLDSLPDQFKDVKERIKNSLAEAHRWRTEYVKLAREAGINLGVTIPASADRSPAQGYRCANCGKKWPTKVMFCTCPMKGPIVSAV
ncbi:hypothetical protein [uncultured Desulfosarcina sp.]|uniref:hypothetical protein n=1 Tax=uncultured Desulfosarcina sp. TaxID=218289 RepID=UPI0029C80B26|nr:hypothetical protein [uncultured Desulfosarcina sp.]